MSETKSLTDAYILTWQTQSCALIHCHRPDLIDYEKLDKVGYMTDLRAVYLSVILNHLAPD